MLAIAPTLTQNARVQIGPYEVLDELGRGGMGVVYRARHTALGRDVALKLLTPSAGVGTDGIPPTRSGDTGADRSDVSARRWIERFRREAQAAGQLGTHAGIVGVLDVGEDDGRLYLAMELIDGHALDQRIRERPPEINEALRIVAQVARAVDYAHGQGIVHRDLKPANILIDAQEHAWVTDFGLAARTVLDAEAQKITRTQDIVGTPAYLAPEQLRGEPVDARTDVHALGCTLYELLAGATPFESPWLPVTCRRVLMDMPAPPSTHRPEVSADLDAVVLRCLAKDPAERYPSAAALAHDCELLLAGESPHTRAPGPIGRLARWAHRRRARLAAAVALVAIATALAAYALSSGDDGARARQLTATQEQSKTVEHAGDIGAALGKLQLATRAEMRLLEDHWHGAIVAPADLARARDAIRLAVGASPQPYARAWGHLADFFADAGAAADADAALARLAAASSGDPVPAALLAHARLESLLQSYLLPMPTLLGTTVMVRQAEHELLSHPRYRSVAAAVEAAGRQPAWARLQKRSALPAFLQAADALVAGDPERAIPVLRSLLDDAFLGGSARRLLGVAKLNAGDPEAALTEWRLLFERRGWRDAQRNALDACTWQVSRLAAGPARDRWMQSAIDLTAAIAAAAPAARDWRAVARWYAIQGGIRWRGNVPMRDAFGPALDALRAATAAADADGESAMSFVQFALALSRQRGATTDAANAWLAEALAQLPNVERAKSEEAGSLAIELELLRLDLFAVQGDVASYQALAARTMDRYDADPANRVRCILAAVTQKALALRQGAYGADPAPTYERGERVIVEGLQRWSSESQLLLLLVDLRSRWAAWSGMNGRPDALARFEAAERSADACVGAEPQSADALDARARVYHGWAEWAFRLGQPADRWWTLALRDADAAIALAPDELGYYERRGISRAACGHRLLQLGIDPTTYFDGAAQDFDRVVSAGVLGPQVLVHLGRLQRFRAELASGQGRDGRASFRAALAALTAAVEANPTWGEARFNRANLYVRAAQMGWDRDRRPAALLDLALADYDVVLQHAPGDADAMANRGAARARRGDYTESAGGDPAPEWLAAIADLQAAAKINPRLWQLHVNAGMIFEGMRRFDDALASYDTALAVNPAANEVAEMAAALRKRLGR